MTPPLAALGLLLLILIVLAPRRRYRRSYGYGRVHEPSFRETLGNMLNVAWCLLLMLKTLVWDDSALQRRRDRRQADRWRIGRK